MNATKRSTKSLDKQIIKTYIQHAWRYPRYVIGLLIMLPVATISFRLIPPLIAASVISRISSDSYTRGDVWGSFGAEIITYAVICMAGGIAGWRGVIYLVWKLEGFVQRDLYRTMFAQLMRLDAGFHNNNFGGSLVSQTSKFVGAYVRLIDTFIFQVYALVISFVFVVIVLYPKAPQFVWALIGFSVVFVSVTSLLSRRVGELSARETEAQHKVTGYLADAITNVMAVKAFATSGSETASFNHATDTVRSRTNDLMWGSLKRDTFSSIVTTSVQVAGLALAVVAVVQYDADIATVFLMFTYSNFVADLLWTFGTTTLRNYNRSIGDAQGAVETLLLSPAVQDPTHPEVSQISKGAIGFNTMEFTHDETVSDDPLFHKLSLQIAPGEKVGLVGHSGSGKTTLTKLLLRYMDIDGGSISIDGQNIAAITQDDLRAAIAYVPQEPLLFHRTIAENIAYSKADASEADIRHAADQANASEFIATLPKGYDTLVGERGVKLSGGQRQRIAIARAMLKDAPVLLLDEATSALDSESEVLIQSALWKLMEGRTAIVIAHRLSTIQKMDRIIVLDNGIIVEQGSHQELLASSGQYARLWSHQSGGFIDDDAASDKAGQQ